MKRIASFGALVALFVLGLAVNGVVPGLAGIGALLGTTTQSSGLDTGTGDFTYDGQTVSAPTDLGNADDNKLQWIRTPLTFDCAPDSLALGGKIDRPNNGSETATFDAPSGAVLVGVFVHSGNSFNFVSAAWNTDGSEVTITLDKGFSGARVIYCTPVTPTTSSGTTSTGTTGTTQTVTTGTTGTTGTTTVTQPGTTVTITTPGQTVTVTVPGGTQTITTPGGTTTVTLPGSTQTVTLPAQTVTSPGQTVTQPANTVTVTGPGQTVTVGGAAGGGGSFKPPAQKAKAKGKRLAHTE